MRNLSFSKNDIHLYVDGEMPPEEQLLFEAFLKENQDMAKEVRACEVLNESLHGAFDGVLDEPIPPALEAAVVIPGALKSSSLRWLQVAASIALVSFGAMAGWFARDGLTGLMNKHSHFLSAAMNAHSVFVPEVRHPVEVSINNEAHLFKWLSKRLGNQVKVPDLSTVGYKLVGGRLLPGEGGIATAQFMYEDAHGERVTFFMMPVSDQKNSNFHYYKVKNLSAYMWTDRPFQYAMIGEMSRDELQKICQIAYDFLES